MKVSRIHIQVRGPAVVHRRSLQENREVRGAF